MKKVLIAGLVGGVVIFIWQFISYTVLPWHMMVIHNIPSGEQISQILKNDGIPGGVYHHPGFPEETESQEEAMKAFTERYKQGANINLMVYAAQGEDPNNPMQFVISYILNVLGAIIAAFMLWKAGGSIVGLVPRALFVAGLGLFTVVSHILLNWNWWGFPGDFILVESADTLVAWFLAGLAIAGLVKPAQG